MKPFPAAGSRPAIRSALFEYALKGLFLSLWAYLVAAHAGWPTLSGVLLWAVAGTVVGLVLGCGQQLLRGYNPTRNPLGFLLLVLLDSPFFIYIGVVGGLGMGLVLTPPAESPLPDNALLYFALAGLLGGTCFVFVRRLPAGLTRLAAGGLLGVGLVLLGFLGGTYLPPFDPDGTSAETLGFMRQLGGMLLAGLPFFYLLMVCGETDETEVEVAALCAALGLGLFCLRPLAQVDGAADKYVFLVPAALYFVYATRVLPRLKVFKHTIRGYGYMSLGRVRDSLASFGRALTLDKKNQLAGKGLMELHRKLDVTKLDPDTTRLLNFDYCLRLAEEGLLGGGTPTAEKRAEAMRMLDLVEQFSPPLRPRVDYLKAVALTHAKDFDLAAGYLSQLLDPTHPADPTNRKVVLFDGWNLALRLHPEIVRRLGLPHLELAGRRIDAIAAVERQLAKTPDDPTAIELKKLVYAGLTEAEFLAVAANGPPPEFNYEYAEQLGLALVDDANPTQVDRGMAFLRTAGRGLPQRGPWIFTKLAQVAERRNDPDAARGYWEQVKRAGLVVGPQRLPADQKELYFAGLDKLVADAVRRGDYAAAVADQRAILEGGREEVNTLRTLAELHAKNGDPLNALLIVSRALLSAKSDPDLLAKKDSYYYSVDVEKVQQVRDKIAPWFDVEYCLIKARKVADMKEPDLDTLDYGLHLARLARVMKPDLLGGMVAEARLLLRKGERDRGVSLLEDVRERDKGSGEEEDAWYLATRMLGDLYLNELQRPDLAVTAYSDYRSYHKSGAETLYQLALAHEAAGNAGAALKCFEAVTGYKEHPRYWDATEAVRRLKGA
ncbi:MAG: hypothetical protein MUF18_01910 [Fimbriiglobus sp.]|jgi:tetratricopeptide (TPR) repeat protein|nr:hypothetical protein [Fimbriiglobus sp.]